MPNDEEPLYEPVQPKKGHYTYKVICSFDMQYTFDEAEVEQDPMGNEGTDFNPTDAALRELESRLGKALEDFGVANIEAYAESDEFLGFVPE